MDNVQMYQKNIFLTWEGFVLIGAWSGAALDPSTISVQLAGWSWIAAASAGRPAVVCKLDQSFQCNNSAGGNTTRIGQVQILSIVPHEILPRLLRGACVYLCPSVWVRERERVSLARVVVANQAGQYIRTMRPPTDAIIKCHKAIKTNVFYRNDLSFPVERGHRHIVCSWGLALQMCLTQPSVTSSCKYL